jgi:hypothetical protein
MRNPHPIRIPRPVPAPTPSVLAPADAEKLQAWFESPEGKAALEKALEDMGRSPPPSASLIPRHGPFAVFG